MQERLFVTNSAALPDLSSMTDARSPEERRRMLEEIGMANIAERDYRLSIAENHFGPMGSDQKLYRWYFQLTSTAKKYSGMVPSGDALAAIHGSSKKKIFDEIQYWSTSNGSEVLAVGVVNIKNVKDYFLIAQWGRTSLTDIEQIRHRRQEADERDEARRRQQDRAERRQKLFGWAWRWREPVAGAVALPMVLIGVDLRGWSLWWLIPALALALGATISICSRGDDLNRRWPKVGAHPVCIWSGWILSLTGLALIANGITSLVLFENATRSKDVLVCNIARDLVPGNGAKDSDWWISGPQGDFDLQAGMYNGTFYPDSHAAAAAFKVGRVYHLTYKGHIGPTYVVSAQSSSTDLGQCGKH